MTRRARDRRRGSGELTTRPPSSPANLLVVVVAGVLAISAAASAVMGGGFDDVTPHGQLLGELRQVADAQESHYARTGSFAAWLRTLELDTRGGIRVTLLKGGGDEWEAVATHPAGLSCTQGGDVRDGRPRTYRPMCFTTSP